ncbi:MAG: imidazoleglycerol-phosphate dehydratase HisB [Candidatus Goldbacteria bacterium]|nr:imidazoleglycerol-phosphate dehydratase HisB [Candidatus Goldiibacteriota bacterium]
MKRQVKVKRKTSETQIDVKINLYGSGKYKIKTDEPFLTHMLEQLSKHSRIDMFINACGDVEIDSHHLVEDLGITLGEVIMKALGNKRGIKRFGSFGVMDESLCRIVLDISGRPLLDFNVNIPLKKIGSFDTELVEEFFNGFVRGARITLHIDQIKGKNSHHIIESIFKGFALALKDAISICGREIPSTKNKI